MPVATQEVVPSSSLSDEELFRLTLYKWRYNLSARGFPEDEVRRLMFQRWLYLRDARENERDSR